MKTTLQSEKAEDGWHVFIVVRSSDQNRVHPKNVQQEMRKKKLAIHFSNRQSKLKQEKQNHVSDSACAITALKSSFLN